MKQFGQDENGVFKRLADGRVLRVEQRMFNSQITLSSSREDPTWSDGW
jgi:hypothetical protein